MTLLKDCKLKAKCMIQVNRITGLDSIYGCAIPV